MTEAHKVVHDAMKDYISWMERSLMTKDADIDLLRKMLHENKEEMDKSMEHVSILMDKEWSQLQEERERILKERERLDKQPLTELKKQIIELRIGYEAQVSQLQKQVRLLEGERNEWRTKVNMHGVDKIRSYYLIQLEC